MSRTQTSAEALPAGPGSPQQDQPAGGDRGGKEPSGSRDGFLRRLVGGALGIGALGALALLDSPLHHLPGLGSRPAYAAAVASLMAIWWFTEALPIAWTAALPLLLFPLFGVFGTGLAGDAQRSAAPYLDAYIFLFLGGMTIGAAMEQWGLHRRVALLIMRAIGSEPRRLLLGVLVATATVSLWISNTATAVMMLPIGLALLAQLERDAGRRLQSFGAAVMLGIAYAANLGGIGTKIGTATNSIFAGFVADKLDRDLGFLEFAALGLPFVVLFLPVIWGALWREARRDHLGAGHGKAVIEREIASLGPMSRGERTVAVVFVVAAVLWIGAGPIKELLAPQLSLLGEGLRLQGKHVEAGVALAAAAALLALGALAPRRLLRLPWGTLVLLGGSFAMAAGLEGSGLATWIGGQLEVVARLPPFSQLLLVSVATIGLSAVASNTAAVNLMLNVLPRSMPLLVGATLAASCDFALPAGTPPNAIVFGSGYIRLPVMMRIGLGLDLAAAVAVAIYVHLWGRLVLGG